MVQSGCARVRAPNIGFGRTDLHVSLLRIVCVAVSNGLVGFASLGNVQTLLNGPVESVLKKEKGPGRGADHPGDGPPALTMEFIGPLVARRLPNIFCFVRLMLYPVWRRLVP